MYKLYYPLIALLNILSLILVTTDTIFTLSIRSLYQNNTSSKHNQILKPVIIELTIKE